MTSNDIFGRIYHENHMTKSNVGKYTIHPMLCSGGNPPRTDLDSDQVRGDPTVP